MKIKSKKENKRKNIRGSTFCSILWPVVPSSDLSQIPQHVPSWPSSDQISSNTKSLAGLEETAGTAWGRVDPKWPITATLTLPYIPLPQTQKLSRAQSGIFETQTLEMLFCSLLGKSVSHGWAVCRGWRCFEDFGPLKKLQSGCIVLFFFISLENTKIKTIQVMKLVISADL